ncbi:hypothetical protein [Paenibacillus sp. IHBB 10380]|uniref:hypothetical protein n=1 Tax=Paenibacillus sp. IHBB 10380 TaxID=1566358 RepID=UPI0006962EFC|nr:hypothetical protein [Paenibacillus sp. IHBB 10380]
MFIKNHAKFTATMGKGIKVGDADVEIKLMLPLKVVQENFMFLSTNQGEKINVIFGDPQASMDFGEDNEDMYRVFTGRRVTADASGIVTRVESHDEDPNQANLFVENQEEGSEPAAEGDDPEVEGSVGEVAESDTDATTETEGESENNLNSELPDWMQEGSDSAGDKEMDFGEPISKTSTSETETVKESAEPTANVVVDKEELEQFILDNKPMFEDIPFDFPTFLRQRREDGMTWMQIAKGVGIPSTQISSKWTVYKKRVASQMRGGGAA